MMPLHLLNAGIDLLQLSEISDIVVYPLLETRRLWHLLDQVGRSTSFQYSGLWIKTWDSISASVYVIYMH